MRRVFPNRGGRRGGRCGVVFALAWLAAAPLAAQTVRGTVMDPQAGTPVAGAFVSLIGASGTRQAGVLSDAGGHFSLRAPAAGRYTLRAEQVGMRSRSSPALELAAGQTLNYTLSLSADPVVLQSLQVEGNRRNCAAVPQAGAATAALWEEVRKALDVAAWEQQRRRLRYTVSTYERELDPRGVEIRNEQKHSRRQAAVLPFASLPAETLSARGYVQTNPQGTFYYAPDAEVLLSDGFLEDHCFRVEQGKGEQANLIGLGFQPVGGRKQPEIRGVLWLDRHTAELRFLEYRYVNLPLDVPTDQLGGNVEFERLPTGAWIVRRWWIRMPMVEIRDEHLRRFDNTPETRRSTVLAGLKQEGGEVAAVAAADDARPPEVGTIALQGTAWDSIRSAPLADATVQLSGTPLSTTTDEGGRFRMEMVPPGTYAVVLDHPRLRALGMEPVQSQVAVFSGKVATADFALPSVATVKSSLCKAALPNGMGLITGTIHDETGAPVAAAQVTISWSRYVVDPDSVHEDRSQIVTVSDARGAYHSCAIPVNTPVMVGIARGEQTQSSAVVEIDADGFLEHDVRLGGGTATRRAQGRSGGE